MTESDRSKLSKAKRTDASIESTSPIAADGGFGPMDYEESEDDSVELETENAGEKAEADGGEGFGEDFDEFEAGAENEEFGDFDEGFEQPPLTDEESPEADPPPPSVVSLPSSTSPFVSKIPLILRRAIRYLRLHCAVQNQS